MNRLILVDGNALLHRAFHATPPLTTSKGELINAIFGFTSMLLRSISDLHPEYIAVAWDMKAPTFRHQSYTQYKSTRRPMDDGLSGQYDRVHQLLKTLNIPEFTLEGYEADDLIGTLARQAYEEHSDLETIILTGDKDIMQTINDRTKVLMPKKTLNDVGLYGVEEFILRFGFEPKQIIEYKALAGDASDNIPGVPGIGEVSATKLIQKFSNIEKIYQPENLATLPERMQKLLAEGAESAVMSKELATIELNAPIKLDLPACQVSDYDHQAATALFQELEFRTLLSKLPNSIHQDGYFQPQTSAEIAPDSPTARLDQEVDLVLKKMSQHGVLIDLQFLDKLSQELKAKLANIETEILSLIGHQFNLNSPKQLAEILFDELKLPVVRKTKTGRSTDEATLQELKPAHPAIPLILDYRLMHKLISTYLDALPKYADEHCRIHSTFNVDGAATGRLSSTNPNLQNIPIRGEIGGELRKAFIAPPGKVLLAADYSQIELRILADITKDPNLKQAFIDRVDIHAATAAKIFNISVDQVNKEQRAVGKTMNFATMYGQGPHALSQQLGVEFAIAKAYIDEYFEQFPNIKAWKAKVLLEAEERGYVETIWGRRRYIPELKSSNRMLKSAGERAAINHPIQGTSADMIKQAMIEIDKELVAISQQAVAKKQSKQSSELPAASCQLILQVHDELVFECDPEGLEVTAKMIKQKMENALVLSVPVVVDLKFGPNWGEMEKLKIA